MPHRSDAEPPSWRAAGSWDEAARQLPGSYGEPSSAETGGGRNGSCIAKWTAWLDKGTHLPVKLHSETTQCQQVRQFDAVAGKVTRT